MAHPLYCLWGQLCISAIILYSCIVLWRRATPRGISVYRLYVLYCRARYICYYRSHSPSSASSRSCLFFTVPEFSKMLLDKVIPKSQHNKTSKKWRWKKLATVLWPLAELDFGWKLCYSFYCPTAPLLSDKTYPFKIDPIFHKERIDNIIASFPKKHQSNSP